MTREELTTDERSGPDPYEQHELPALAARALRHAYVASVAGMSWLFGLEWCARFFGFADDRLQDAAVRCLVPAGIGGVCALIDRRVPISTYRPFLQGYGIMASISVILALSARATGGMHSPYVISLSTMLYLWGLIMPGGARRSAWPVLTAPVIFFAIVGYDEAARFDVRSGVAVLFTFTSACLSLAYAEVQERWRRGASTASSLDALTQLFNRRYLLERFAALHAASRAGARPISVLALDIDHFKRINDTHGHAVGDEVLRRVARVLSQSTRAHDVSGRLGGEEFVLVLDGCDAATATAVAERIRASIEGLSLDDLNDTSRVTVSVGIATQPIGVDFTVDALLQAADEALYESKRAGRNRVSLATGVASFTPAPPR